MTKIQSKLQRHYLQKADVAADESGIRDHSQDIANNRSNNPTVITNRSGSKQSALKQYELNSDRTSESNNHKSLKNRL